MPPLSLMIKPASSLCNMRCAYCFYRDVAAHRAAPSYGMMTEETLHTLVRRAFTYAEGSVSFAFQGGEPTLAGLPFYQRLVALQKQYNTRQLQVHNALQTNGLAIDGAFADFLAENHFLVGVSLDGAKATHDALRKGAADEGTYDRVLASLHLMRARGVECNVLCVVSALIASHPEETFEALAPFGYVQFIPCLDGFDAAPDAHSLTPGAYAAFLCKTFDLYERAYKRGKPVSVRTFDNYLQMLAGYPPEHCGMGGGCSRYYLIEADGGVYPCDFYVLDEWRLGNINEHSFARLAKAPQGEAFIQGSRYVDAKCKACPWLTLCRGGCRRDREPFVDEHPALNRFCESFQQFFAYAHPRMSAMAHELLARR